MSDVLLVIICAGFAFFAKSQGRNYWWGIVPALIKAAFQTYAQLGGGPSDTKAWLYSAVITYIIYWVVGKAVQGANAGKESAE